MVADVCSPETRGTLFGVCSVAALLGPVLGPPLGGGLSQVSIVVLFFRIELNSGFAVLMVLLLHMSWPMSWLHDTSNIMVSWSSVQVLFLFCSST